jgi:hypothetical protein
MQRHQLAHQRQTDAQPALRQAHIAADLVEHLEDRVVVLGRDAHAAVGHCHHGLSAIAPVLVHREADAAAGRRVLGCIGQQIIDHLRDAGRVDVQQQRLAPHLHVEHMARALDHRRAGFDRARHHAIEVDQLLADIDLAAGDAGDIEQIVDQVRHLARLALEHFAYALDRLGTVGAQAHDFQAGADRGHRVAQLVRQHRQEFAAVAAGLGRFVRLALQGCALAGVDFEGRMEEAMHGAGGIAQRRKSSVKVARVGSEQHVVQPGRRAGKRAVDQRRETRPGGGQDGSQRLAQRLRGLFAQQAGVGIVEQHRQGVRRRGTPANQRRMPRVEHQVDGHPQFRRPAGRVAQCGCCPIVVAHQRARASMVGGHGRRSARIAHGLIVA